MPICVPDMMPNRYSRPICAPESKPKKSDARLPNDPWPSGRVKRWVTRNELRKRGIRSVVGRAMRVKSGWEGFTALSLGACEASGACCCVCWAASCDCCACGAIEEATTSTAMAKMRGMSLFTSIVGGPEGDPAFDDLHLSDREV